MRELVGAYPFLSQFCPAYRVRIVIDANVVLSDLHWLAKRDKPEARTRLQEVLAAGTVVAFAPHQLEAEVRRHMPRVARKAKVPVERLEEEWATYRTAIRFRTPAEGERPAWVQDPDDLPYLYLRTEIGAQAIYTFDPDLKAMGAPVIGADIMVALRDYSREASLEITIRVGGMVVVVTGVATVRAIWELLQQFIAAIAHLPRGAKLVIAGAVLGMLVHPRGRAMLHRWLAVIPARAGAILKLLVPRVGEALVKAADANHRARAALARAEPALGASKPQPLRIHALRVCMDEERPLSVDEMARLILRDGYVTRAKDFPRYLRRVLASRAEFTRSASGAWSLTATA
jgi:predicted nucleic acid-binding protein